MYVCGSCNIEFQRTHLGVVIIETFMRPPKPYRLWKADVLICSRCGYEVVQSAHQPFAEHYQDGFAHKLELALSGPHFYAFERVSDAEDHAAKGS